MSYPVGGIDLAAIQQQIAQMKDTLSQTSGLINTTMPQPTQHQSSIVSDPAYSEFLKTEEGHRLYLERAALFNTEMERLSASRPAGVEFFPRERKAFEAFKKEFEETQEATKEVYAAIMATPDFDYIAAKVRAARKAVGQSTDSDSVIDEVKKSKIYAELEEAIVNKKYKKGMFMEADIAKPPTESQKADKSNAAK